MILVHGWGVSSVWFSEMIPFLVDHGYRVTIFDTPGHGKSEHRPGQIKYEDLKADYQYILEKLNLKDKPYGLLGWSAGGGIIQRFYFDEDLRKNIKCLILLGTSYSVIEDPISKRIWSSLTLPITLGFSPLLIYGKKRLIKRMAPLLSIVWNKPKRSIEMWLRDLFLLDQKTLKKELGEMLKFNLKDELPSIDCPTLIIAGTKDMLTPVKVQKEMHELIPSSELQLVKGAGHIGIVVASDEFNRLIVEFLKKHGF